MRNATPTESSAVHQGFSRSGNDTLSPSICEGARQSVTAIIVSYNPRIGELQRLLTAIANHVDDIVIVDNGSQRDIADAVAELALQNLVCLKLGTNRGVAAALNQGVAWARKRGSGRVVLFDQDSIPASDMVNRLMSELTRLEAAGIAVAAVGPCFRDPRSNNRPPFIRIQRGRVTRAQPVVGVTSVEVDYLITSGSVIPLAAFDIVGPLEERLFIDYVDIEWGLRAKRKGLRSFGVFAASMEHSLGDAPINIAGARFAVHSPLRHYYHFRNATWLTRQIWVPLQWKFVNTYRLVGKLIIYGVFASPRREHLKMMLKGVWDGIRDRLGPHV